LAVETNRLSIKADVTLRPDGTPEGTSTIEGRGAYAADLRAAMQAASLAGADAYVTTRLGFNRWYGQGSLALHDPFDHAEPYTVKTTFDLTNKLFGEGDNLNAIPFGPRLSQNFADRIANAVLKNRTQDFFCEAGVYDLSIDLRWPDGVSLKQAPEAVDVSSSLGSYRATYALLGRTLHVERRAVSRVPGQSCTPDMAKTMAKVVKAGARDFATRLEFETGPEREGEP
jgi:hypothetical protein